MSLIPSHNFKHNQTIPSPEGLINGQSLGTVSGMKFGLSTVSYSGCEVIAVYNALLLRSRRADFVTVARYMERFRVMLGFWGTNFLSLGHCLRHFGIRAKRIRSKAKMRAALAENQVCLYVFWVGKRFRSPVHTVCMRTAGEGRILVWNAYNNCNHVINVPEDDYLRRHMIFGYITEKAAE